MMHHQRVGCLLVVTKLDTPGVWTEKEKIGYPRYLHRIITNGNIAILDNEQT